MALGLDYWREYFRGANSDIFGVIEHAIMVAALDCPKQFKLRRDQVAELLFTCKMTKCFGCDRVELSLPKNNNNGEETNDDDKSKHGEFDEAGGSKESKVNSSGDNHQVEMEVNVNQVSNYSYGEAEALTDEIEQESQLIGEVLRIKGILDNHSEESDSVLFESLRRLQLMDLSVEILKATEIGKSANSLKKHGSKQIRDLVRTLVEGWVVMVDEWVNATAAIAENTSESVKTSAEDQEEGLPSPPLDEGFFFATQTTALELSQVSVLPPLFFEGMDEDGNPRNSGEFNKNCENGRKPLLVSRSSPKHKQQLPNDSLSPVKEKKVVNPMKEEAVLKKQSAVVKPNNPFCGSSGIGRPAIPSVQQKVKNETQFQPKSDKGAIRRKPLAPQRDLNVKNGEQLSDRASMRKKPLAPEQDKLRCSNEASIQVKLEAAKRKLQERYEEAKNAKRQRTIQVMELHDIPKKVIGRNSQMKPGNRNHNRHWANRRH